MKKTILFTIALVFTLNVLTVFVYCLVEMPEIFRAPATIGWLGISIGSTGLFWLGVGPELFRRPPRKRYNRYKS